MVNAYLVYGLVDPRSGELRYVGKSCSGLARPRAHARRLKWDRGHCRNWVKSLVDAGLKPEVEVLEGHETAEALVEAEKHFIAYFRSIGCNLTNVTAGGDGTWGTTKSPETRLKMSLAHRNGGALRVRDEALRMYATGMSTRAVARELGIGYGTVSVFASDAGVLRGKAAAHSTATGLRRRKMKLESCPCTGAAGAGRTSRGRWAS
jgi:hypothetical protein